MKALRSEIFSLNVKRWCDSHQLDSRLVIWMTWIKSNGTLKIDLRRRSKGDSEILSRRFDVVPQRSQDRPHYGSHFFRQFKNHFGRFTSRNILISRDRSISLAASGVAKEKECEIHPEERSSFFAFIFRSRIDRSTLPPRK